eukprot:9836617-Lingulodinium_polyedra.AAC.1
MQKLLLLCTTLWALFGPSSRPWPGSSRKHYGELVPWNKLALMDPPPTARPRLPKSASGTRGLQAAVQVAPAILSTPRIRA